MSLLLKSGNGRLEINELAERQGLASKSYTKLFELCPDSLVRHHIMGLVSIHVSISTMIGSGFIVASNAVMTSIPFTSGVYTMDWRAQKSFARKIIQVYDVTLLVFDDKTFPSSSVFEFGSDDQRIRICDTLQSVGFIHTDSDNVHSNNVPLYMSCSLAGIAKKDTFVFQGKYDIGMIGAPIFDKDGRVFAMRIPIENDSIPSEIIPSETKDESKDETNDASKDETKDEAKDETKDEFKDETKDKAKDETKDKAKDEAKDETKDESKDETKIKQESKAKTENKREESKRDREHRLGQLGHAISLWQVFQKLDQLKT